jgi:MSHA biogenesis protein MshI
VIPDFLKRAFTKKQHGVSLALELASGGIAWAVAGDGIHEVRTGVVEVESASRHEALQELITEHSLKGAVTNLVLSQDQYQIFQAERPPVEAHELAEAVRWKLGELLDYPANQAVIDTFPFPDDATRDRGKLINAVCAHQELIGGHVEFIREAGLELNRIDVAELALRNLLAYADPEGRGAALLYLSENHGHMVFCRGNMIYMARRIEVSLAQLRDAASQEQAVQALALEMQRSLDYFESQLRQVPPGRIQVAGHPEHLPLAGMLTTNVTAEVADFDWRVVLGDETPEPDPRAGLALGALLATDQGGAP